MISILLLTMQLIAGAPPGTTADLYFQKAMNMSAQELSKTGSRSCVDGIQPDESVRGYGNTMQNAQTHFILKCMRKKCETLDQEIAFEKNEILNSDHAEVAELLRFYGLDPKILNGIDRSRVSTSGSCQNSTALTRMFVFDVCASRPLACF